MGLQDCESIAEDKIISGIGLIHGYKNGGGIIGKDFFQINLGIFCLTADKQIRPSVAVNVIHLNEKLKNPGDVRSRDAQRTDRVSGRIQIQVRGKKLEIYMCEKELFLNAKTFERRRKGERNVC